MSVYDDEPNPIPKVALDSWAATPPTQLLGALTQAEATDLYYALRSLIFSQSEMQQSLIEYSRQNFGRANEHMTNSQTYVRDSLFYLNAAMTNLMLKAKP